MRSCLVGFKKQTKQLAICVIQYDGYINITLHVETVYLCIILVDLVFQICKKMMDYSLGMKLQAAKVSTSPVSHYCKSDSYMGNNHLTKKRICM